MSAQIQFADSEQFITFPLTNRPKSYPNCVELAVPRGLTKRMIYLFFEVLGPATQFIIKGNVNLWNGGVLETALPIGFQNGMSDNLEKSLPMNFCAGGSPVANSLLVNLRTFGGSGGATSAVLQPFFTNVECDKITVDITSLVNPPFDATFGYVYLACRSNS